MRLRHRDHGAAKLELAARARSRSRGASHLRPGRGRYRNRPARCPNRTVEAEPRSPLAQGSQRARVHRLRVSSHHREHSPKEPRCRPQERPQTPHRELHLSGAPRISWASLARWREGRHHLKARLWLSRPAPRSPWPLQPVRRLRRLPSPPPVSQLRRPCIRAWFRLPPAAPDAPGAWGSAVGAGAVAEVRAWWPEAQERSFGFLWSFTAGSKHQDRKASTQTRNTPHRKISPH